MPVIHTKINKQSNQYLEQYSQMLALVDELNWQIEQAKSSVDESIIARHKKRGKLLAKERVTRLLDADSPFLEFSPLAAKDVYADNVPGAGILTGIGRVHGREIMIIANDATVKGGTYYPLTVKKHCRAQEVAAENNLPCVYLVDSGGAFLPMQDEVFPDRDHFGRIFYQQARLSAKGIPQISVVMGLCIAGGAYIPAMSDECVIVRKQGSIYLGGPELVRAATGEEANVEELGGGEMHSRISGVTDYLVNNDVEALEKARNILGNLHRKPPAFQRDREPLAPLYADEELYGLIPVESKTQYEVREVIARIVDASLFDEFKPLYGTTLVCGFAHIDGYLVGIIANNGILFSESANKATHFIQLCCQRSIPLVFLQNITGFMIGKAFEQGGIAKHGAKMVKAVATANVPKFTVIIGGSFGAGNYAMCGRAYQPRQLWMWPNARIAVMGGEMASAVLRMVKKEGMDAKGQHWNSNEQHQFEEKIQQQFHQQSNPYYATARLWDDGIIDPTQTRAVLAMGLAAAANAPIEPTEFGVFRM